MSGYRGTHLPFLPITFWSYQGSTNHSSNKEFSLEAYSTPTGTHTIYLYAYLPTFKPHSRDRQLTPPKQLRMPPKMPVFVAGFVVVHYTRLSCRNLDEIHFSCTELNFPASCLSIK